MYNMEEERAIIEHPEEFVTLDSVVEKVKITEDE